MRFRVNITFTTYYSNGQPYIVEYRANGVRFNSVLIYDATGKKIREMCYINSQFEEYNTYLQNGLLHNLHGPSDMGWFDDGPKYISYRQNNLLHNLHGIAHISWYRNGQIENIQYRQNDKLHNLYGPAVIYWYDNGKFNSIAYYHNGKFIKKTR